MHVISADPVVVPAAKSPVTPPLAAPERAWTVAGIHAAGLYLTAPAGPKACAGLTAPADVTAPADLTAPSGPHTLVIPVIGMGAYDLPTAIRTHVPADVFTTGVRTGDRVEVEPDRLLLPAAELRIRRVWRPQRISGVRCLGIGCGHPDSHSAEHRGRTLALGAVRAALQPGIADAEASAEDIVATALDGSRGAASRCGRVDQALAERVAALIGRGPGLTPSGDDVLSGIALTLRWQSAWCALAQLRAALTPQLASTTAISASLLEAALDGWCTTPVTRALGAAQAGDLPAFAEHLGAIGHTSGYDLGAGVVATCRALSRPSSRSAGGSPDPTEGEDCAVSR
ncbi:DUF2877 domain-containing protein [Brevibacterium sp. p3-SID960]|uniref:DUF2877 domain-containing protein n=1 Tax=Brevibacterium sp. p3-SID960 TaxID=2916063 RepID=UPI0021A8877E|nr:DUF2877 domain-containing protein [Brevibacterium sp. p3-SID960]MCT1691125.1 DUF2877 domain-containing protein [Brevibacterium sp. p3-SID960]